MPLPDTDRDTIAPEGDAGQENLPVLEMVQPLAGFPDQRRYALTRLDDTGVVCDLRSLDDPGLRFVVVPPSPFFAGYVPTIDEAAVEKLGVENESDLIALLVVTLGETPGGATANLLAPVLVNHRTRKAGQYLLTDTDLSMREPLCPDWPAPHA